MRRSLGCVLRIARGAIAGTGDCGAAAKKHLLFIGEEKGYRHEAVTHAMATIERLGRETGFWDTTFRTDTEALTKKKLEYNAKNLNDFDAVMFFTGGTLEMDEQQKADFISFIHDDGKGFIGVHSAAITFTDWPEYGEMIGGYYDEHPWANVQCSDHCGRSCVSGDAAVAARVRDCGMRSTNFTTTRAKIRGC